MRMSWTRVEGGSAGRGPRTRKGTASSPLAMSCRALLLPGLLLAGGSGCRAADTAAPPRPAETSRVDPRVRDFLAAHRGEYGLQEDLANLRLTRRQESRTAQHYRFQQLVNGVPLENAEIVVSILPSNGAVAKVHSTLRPGASAPVPEARITTEQALDIGWNHLRVHGKLTAPPSAELVYAADEGRLRLIVKTLISVDAPLGSWEHRIDAGTGAILSCRDTSVDAGPQAAALPDFAAYQGPVTPRAAATAAWAEAVPENRRGKE